MKTNRVMALLLICLSLVCFPACNKTTLEPGGAYAPEGQQADIPFFVLDAAFKTAHSSADAVFLWERENEKALWKLNHNIKYSIDKMRLEAMDIEIRYARARKVYLANPTPSGLSDLELVLANIQKLSASAQAVIPKGK